MNKPRRCVIKCKPNVIFCTMSILESIHIYFSSIFLFLVSIFFVYLIIYILLYIYIYIYIYIKYMLASNNSRAHTRVLYIAYSMHNNEAENTRDIDPLLTPQH